MSWPPDELWPRIAALWATHDAPSADANSRAKAFTALKQYQADFDLSDCQLAYIVEHQVLDPSSRLTKRERLENAFEIMLGIIDDVGLVFPFEYAVVVAVWILHTYVFDRFLHTPRLLIYSREPGCGKTVLLVCIEALAHNPFRVSSTTPAVLYHWLKEDPRTTFLLDEVEHSTLWDRSDPSVEVIDTGHRVDGYVPRVPHGKVVRYPTFAPLALATVIGPGRKEKFPRQVASRSVPLELIQSFAGRDEIVLGDPRFLPARASALRWADKFQRSKTIDLPKELRGRCADNWRVLIAIADSLGYGATLRAAAVMVEEAGFDPEVKFYEDLHRVFARRGDGLWTSEIVQAMNEMEHGRWASLTNTALYDRLYRKRIDPKTIWKVGTDGKRRSNKGFAPEQFEPVWREFGIGHSGTHNSKIIRLPRHKSGTSEAQ
jgi:hypothetical protein